MSGCGRRDPLDGPELAELLAGRDEDHFHDECGVFGVQGHPEASNITYLGLYALQHRSKAFPLRARHCGRNTLEHLRSVF